MSLISYIHSALEDVGLLVKDAQQHQKQTFEVLRLHLGNLKTFVLSVRKMDGQDASITSLLARLEETIHRNADRIHPLRPPLTDEHLRVASEFYNDIDSFVSKILRGYLYTWRPTACIADDHVLEIIASVFESLAHLKALLELNPNAILIVQSTVEAFEEHMSFMKSLISLASKTGCVEPLQDLLAHAEAVMVTAGCYILSAVYEFKSLMSTLLQIMKPVDPQVYGAYTRVLRGLLSPTVDYMHDDAFFSLKGFLDSLIPVLWEQLRMNIDSASMRDVQKLYEMLRSLRAVLKKQPNTFGMKVKKAIGDAVCEAGLFICLLQRTPTVVDQFLQILLGKLNNVLIETMAKVPATSIIEAGVSKISASKQVTATSSHMPSPGTAALLRDDVVGLQEEETLIVDRLTRGSQQLRMVAIVGMPGLGKTTLATKVCSSRAVSLHFHVQSWCVISQKLDKKRVLLELLSKSDPSRYSKLTTDSHVDRLADLLRKSLKGRRYLIFLDDMWDTEAWNNLRESFPDDNVGSRIIVTSRLHDVAPPEMLDQAPHSLHPLNAEDSFELLQRELSDVNCLPPVSLELAKICRGLPLLIVIIAGVLRNIKPEDWDGVLDGLSSASITEQCANTLDLSYQHLPANLKPCLVYFGAFREDEEVSVKRLIRLWIAEGMVQKDGMNSLEDAAQLYLEDLISRSLLMVSKQKYGGGVKTCRIHDLIHGFCVQKAKDGRLFHSLEGFHELSAFNEPYYLQRLYIHSEAEDLIESKLFCPRARALTLTSTQSADGLYAGKWWPDISPAIHIFKLLRVLDLEQVNLGGRFPYGLELLVHLVFLAIQCNVRSIPSWLGDLSNLETFIMQVKLTTPSLPDSLWNLGRLKYLCIKRSSVGLGSVKEGGCLPIQNLDNSAALLELEILSGVVIPYSKVESLLRKFPNIRELKCRLECLIDETGEGDLLVPDFLSRLESLSMLWYPSHSCVAIRRSPVIVLDKMSFPANLMKLTLDRFSLSWTNMSTIGQLPNLQVLSLLYIRFQDDTWEMKEGEFAKLRRLKFISLPLTRWRTDDDDQLSCLQKLVLYECLSLAEMPSCLEYIPTLETIEISRCLSTVVDLAKQIDKSREELMGESGLKIITGQIFQT